VAHYIQYGRVRIWLTMVLVSTSSVEYLIGKRRSVPIWHAWYEIENTRSADRVQDREFYIDVRDRKII
jgi:hypothetical protein